MNLASLVCHIFMGHGTPDSIEKHWTQKVTLQIARVAGVDGIMGMLMTEYVLKIGCYEFGLV